MLQSPNPSPSLDSSPNLNPLGSLGLWGLQVLYHTTDPVAMLRTLWKSMAPRATLIVDCQVLITIMHLSSLYVCVCGGLMTF